MNVSTVLDSINVKSSMYNISGKIDFQTRDCYTAQGGFKLTIILPQPPCVGIKAPRLSFQNIFFCITANFIY